MVKMYTAQRTQVQVPAPTLDGLQLHVTSALGDPTTSSGFHRHLYTQAHIHTGIHIYT